VHGQELVHGQERTGTVFEELIVGAEVRSAQFNNTHIEALFPVEHIEESIVEDQLYLPIINTK